MVECFVQDRGVEPSRVGSGQHVGQHPDRRFIQGARLLGSKRRRHYKKKEEARDEPGLPWVRATHTRAPECAKESVVGSARSGTFRQSPAARSSPPVRPHTRRSPPPTPSRVPSSG